MHFIVFHMQLILCKTIIFKGMFYFHEFTIISRKFSWLSIFFRKKPKNFKYFVPLLSLTILISSQLLLLLLLLLLVFSDLS